MTKKAQDAYIRGFCKVAEAGGVDPEELYKYAQANALVKSVGSALGSAGKAVGTAAKGAGKAGFLNRFIKSPLKRYWELLNGGNADKIVDGVKSVAPTLGGNTNASFKRLLELNPELRKVFTARAATGLGLAGVGTAVGEHKAYKRGREGKKMNWWNY